MIGQHDGANGSASSTDDGASERLARCYRSAHDALRALDGLQPQDALDEVLKYIQLRRSDPDPMPRNVTPATLRRALATCVRRNDATFRTLFTDRRFRLSDPALTALHEQLHALDFERHALDLHSAAIRSVLPPEARRGLGMYLTPDEVVSAIVDVVEPAPDAKVYDLACGSGTFLIETARRWAASNRRPVGRLLGSDVNARMVCLAQLALSAGGASNRCRFAVLDALSTRTDGPRAWPKPGTIDVVLTNPPFGAFVPATVGHTRRDVANRPASRIPSEIVFIERSLQWLRRGGMLAIVLPRSVLTNSRLDGSRRRIDSLARLVGVLHLPPETFAATGTQSATCVLFFVRGPRPARPSTVSVPVADVTNVGYDATGRIRPGADLPSAALALRDAMRGGDPYRRVRRVEVAEGERFAGFADAERRMVARIESSGRRLGDVLEFARTGRTPARSEYAPSGLFVLKVGNLTGQGIDWTPRERNFVNDSPADRRLVAPGDIVLTASAHHVRYIAQKVDVVHAIPDVLNRKATFVGEVMQLRVKPGACDPLALVAFLRSSSARNALQRMVRGQTAHLHARDVLHLELPEPMADPEIVALLRRECELAFELSKVVWRQRELLERDRRVD